MSVINVTRFHLILLALVVLGAGVLGVLSYGKSRRETQLRWQRETEEQRRTEEAAQVQQRESELLRLKNEAATALAQLEESSHSLRLPVQHKEALGVALRDAKNFFIQGSFVESLAAAKRLQEFLAAVPPEPPATRYRVQRGDTLWDIAKHSEHFGLGSGWYDIWKVNRETIPDFDRIHPNQEIVIPLEK